MALAGAMRSEFYDAGQTVFRIAESAERFFLVARGVVDVVRPDGEQEVVVNRLEDGDFFGEIALLSGSTRSATVRAMSPTVLLSIDAETFHTLIADSSAVEDAIRSTAAERLAGDQPTH